MKWTRFTERLNFVVSGYDYSFWQNTRTWQTVRRTDRPQTDTETYTAWRQRRSAAINRTLPWSYSPCTLPSHDDVWPTLCALYNCVMIGGNCAWSKNHGKNHYGKNRKCWCLCMSYEVGKRGVKQRIVVVFLIFWKRHNMFTHTACGMKFVFNEVAKFVFILGHV